jgi:hypothetical protein
MKYATLTKNEEVCAISLESNENSFVLMISEGQKSTEIRYFHNQKEAEEIYQILKNKKLQEGWVESGQETNLQIA